MIGKPWDNGDLLIYISLYPLVNKQFAIENGPVEIVDLPMKSSDVP